MARLNLGDAPTVPPPVPGSTGRCYVVVHTADQWFIKFDGQEFGPYQSEREALLFAVDAAHKLCEQGEATQVLLMDESGEAQPAWTPGRDSYPPPL